MIWFITSSMPDSGLAAASPRHYEQSCTFSPVSLSVSPQHNKKQQTQSEKETKEEGLSGIKTSDASEDLLVGQAREN